MNDSPAKSLVSIGFSPLEAEMYVVLLQKPGLTGYRIAQLLGKPVPNIYNALESLQRKGVVLSSRRGKSRRYAVVPVEDYMDQIERDYKEKRKGIEKGLSAIRPLPPDEEVYRIENTQQFYQRSIGCMSGAKEIIAVDACPGPFQKIRGSLLGIAKVKKVIGKVYTPDDAPGWDSIVYEIRGSIFERWTVEWLHVFVDGREYVMGLFDKERGDLVHGVWSNSPYLSMMAYNGFMCEFVLSHLQTMLSEGATAGEMVERIGVYKPFFIQQLRAVDSFVAALGGER